MKRIITISLLLIIHFNLNKFIVPVPHHISLIFCLENPSSRNGLHWHVSGFSRRCVCLRQHILKLCPPVHVKWTHKLICTRRKSNTEIDYIAVVDHQNFRLENGTVLFHDFHAIDKHFRKTRVWNQFLYSIYRIKCSFKLSAKLMLLLRIFSLLIKGSYINEAERSIFFLCLDNW